MLFRVVSVSGYTIYGWAPNPFSLYGIEPNHRTPSEDSNLYPVVLSLESGWWWMESNHPDDRVSMVIRRQSDLSTLLTVRASVETETTHCSCITQPAEHCRRTLRFTAVLAVNAHAVVPPVS